MKYSLILHKQNNQYGMETKTDNPFDTTIPDRELSIFMDWLNTEKAKNKVIIDKNFYDEGYFEDNGKTGKSGLVDYEEFSKTFASEHADRIEKVLNYDKTKSIGEIGCAFGWTIDELRKRGYNAYGFDISKWIVNQYPREYIRECDIQYQVPSVTGLDLIYSFATFEHFACENIRDVFRNLKIALKEDGILFATIDNIWGEDVSHQLLRSREWWDNIAEQHKFEDIPELTKIYKDINGYVWRKV